MKVWQIQVQATIVWSRVQQVTCFRERIDEIFKELPNVHAITDDVLIVGYDSNGTDHDESPCRVLKVYKKENLKLNKDKCNFRCTSVPCFGKIISMQGMRPDLGKLKAVMDVPQSRKVLQTFLGRMICLRKFLPATGGECEPL